MLNVICQYAPIPKMSTDILKMDLEKQQEAKESTTPQIKEVSTPPVQAKMKAVVKAVEKAQNLKVSNITSFINLHREIEITV